MKYDILTDTDFFKAIHDGDEEGAKRGYGDFIESVARLCRN